MKTTDLSWYKAAVIGSIWASVEIIFGSFFHTLRIPFAGTFLTFMSVVLLTAFAVKWHEKNLFVKAGLIAALMRSMVPTSVILGPFIGIMTEALLFQLAVNILGRRPVAFILAGILAMYSAVVHKVISILLIYGMDVVTILRRLYEMFLRMTGWNLPPGKLFIVVGVVYTSAGILAALAGMRMGKKAWNQPPSALHTRPSTSASHLFDLSRFHYRPVLLFLHFAALITGFFLLEKGNLRLFFPLFTAYELFIILRYKKNLRRLTKWIFWFQLTVIWLITILLWDDKYEGALTGLKMILRALWIISVFVAVSVELKNPVVKSLLTRSGYGNIYNGLQMATEILPLTLAELSKEKNQWFNPVKIMEKALRLSDAALDAVKEKEKNTAPVMLITGETASGKTTLLQELLKEREIKDSKICGFLSLSDAGKKEFYLYDLQTKTRHLLCDRMPGKGKQAVGRFYFYPETLETGKEILKNALSGDCAMIIVDEVGQLELSGDGWHDVLPALLEAGKPVIWTVKKKFVNPVTEFYSIHPLVVDVDDKPGSSRREEAKKWMLSNLKKSKL